MNFDTFKEKFTKMVRLKQASFITENAIKDFYEEMQHLQDEDILFAMATLSRSRDKLELSNLLELAKMNCDKRKLDQDTQDRETLERAPMPPDCRDALKRMFDRYKS